MSPLLYQVTFRIDGSRDAAAIAELVTGDLSRTLTADQVRHVIAAKLIPLGLVARPGTPAAAPTASPLLALRARGTLRPEPVAVIGSVLALDYWLFVSHGLSGGLAQVLRDPVDLRVVVGLTVLSATFHECGHATGCRYGGARPGRIGVGVYLIWPSFFTNVTDSFRLSRGGRLRTGLGGLYFNLLFVLALAGVYSVTSAQVLLLVIVITHLEMLEQLLSSP